jgi:hypothetical protein
MLLNSLEKALILSQTPGFAELPLFALRERARMLYSWTHSKPLPPRKTTETENPEPIPWPNPSKLP